MAQKIRNNIIANYAGKFWSVISAFIFLPLWIEILGFNNYAIISLTLVVTSFTVFFDSGLTATLSRELARSDLSENNKYITLKTLECCYFGIAFLLFVVLQLLVVPIINNVRVQNVDIHLLKTSLRVVSIGIPLQMLMKYYIGGLLGLENHVKANYLLIGWGVLRNGFVTLAIYLNHDLLLFFWWQTLASLLFIFISRYILIREFSVRQEYDFFIFDSNVLLGVYRFAFGMLLISLVAGLNSQLDKLLISKYISLDVLGYYTLATSLAGGMLFIANPVASALLPRFTRNFSLGNSSNNAILFRDSTYLISVFLFPISASFVINSSSILFIWTGNMEIATNTEMFLRIFGLSYTFLALQVIPYNYLISTGDTRFNNKIGIVSLLFTIPSFIISAKYFGANYTAIAILLVQIIVFSLYVRKLTIIKIISDLKRWVLGNIFSPLASSFLTIWVLNEFLYIGDTRGLRFITVFVQMLLAIIINLYLVKSKRINIKKLIGG